MVASASVVLLVGLSCTAGSRTATDNVPVTAVDERVELGHNSPTVVAHPEDDEMLALASRVDHPDFSCVLHLSGDGGRSWVPASPIAALPPGVEKCYAPEVLFDRHGRLFFLFAGLSGAGNRPVGAFLVSSADRGRTWTEAIRVLGPERYMVRLGISPHEGRDGRLHLVWVQTGADPPLGGFPATPNPVMASHSDDGGRTWSEPVRVSDPSRQRVVGPAVTVSGRGVVRIVYFDLEDDARDYQGLEGPTWEGSWTLVMATSVDGGRTYGPGVVVDAEVVPIERVMLIFTMPPPAVVADDDGLVAVAWHDGRHEDWDVLLRRSGDGGATWSAPVRVNDDRPGNPRHQYLPRLALAPGGRLDALFYDRRADPENLRNDVMLVASVDGGRTFGANRRLTTDPSHSEVGPRYLVPSATGLVELGSRIGLLSTDDAVVAAWTDTRNSDIGTSQQDVFSARLDLADGGWGGWSPVALGGVAGLLAAVALGAPRLARRVKRS